jgi:hypothetical protein
MQGTKKVWETKVFFLLSCGFMCFLPSFFSGFPVARPFFVSALSGSTLSSHFALIHSSNPSRHRAPMRLPTLSQTLPITSTSFAFFFSSLPFFPSLAKWLF